MAHFKYLLFFTFIFLSLQCKKDDKLPECPNCDFTCIPQGTQEVVTNDCKNNFTCDFELHPNSKLNYSGDNFDNYIKSGNNLVFRMSLHTEGQANIADDEFTDLLYFEIDPSMESFSAENDQLDLLNVRSQRTCFCAEVLPKKPSGGCMQGQRIDGHHWQVQANLTVEYDGWTREVKMDAVFSK